MAKENITFRTSREQRQKLNSLAVQMGATQSMILRMLIETAEIREAATLAPVGRLRERSQAQMSG